MTSLNAIGVDLSFTATGIAWAVDASDVFDTDPTQPDHVRAQRIALDVLAHTAEACHLVVIEAGVHRSHHAWRAGVLHGIVRSALEIHRPGLPVASVAPGALKRFATGKGSADKTAMVIAARDRLGYQAVDHNEADSLWLRQIGMHLLGAPEVDLPKAHLVALDKIERPEGLR